jgi:hypothetical protein
MSVTGSPRLVPVELRLVLTQLKAQKPQYAPFVASIQAVINEAFGPLGILAYGAAGGRVTSTDVSSYVNAVKSEVGTKLQPLGVTFDFSVSPTSGGLSVSWTATKGASSDTGSHTITGNVEDVSDDWLQSLTIAANRFSRWVQTLDAAKAKSILDAAAVGYETFMTSGTPTAKQQMAALKHKLRIKAVDPTLYVSQLQNGAAKYQTGYQAAVDKYRVVAKWVMDALLGATKATISVVKVL